MLIMRLFQDIALLYVRMNVFATFSAAENDQFTKVNITKRLSSLAFSCENATLIEKYLILKIDGDRIRQLSQLMYYLYFLLTFSNKSIIVIQKKTINYYILHFYCTINSSTAIKSIKTIQYEISLSVFMVTFKLTKLKQRLKYNQSVVLEIVPFHFSYRLSSVVRKRSKNEIFFAQCV